MTNARETPSRRANPRASHLERSRPLKAAFPNSLRTMAWNLFVILVLFLLSVLFFRGSMSRWGVRLIFPLVQVAAVVTLAVCVMVLAPCAVFRRTRMFSAVGLQAASYVFATTTWLFCFMVLSSLWRLPGVIAGVVLGVVGVIPLALIAALSNGLWKPTTLITLGLGVTIAAYFAATFVASRLGRPFI